MPPSLECLRHVLEEGSPSEINLLFGAIDKRPSGGQTAAQNDRAHRSLPRPSIEMDEDVDRLFYVMPDVGAAQPGAGVEREHDQLLDSRIGGIGMDAGHRTWVTRIDGAQTCNGEIVVGSVFVSARAGLRMRS